ncbi:SDH family Clp fold serine proteinase [Lacipirellula parvula]|uniref:Uncharacterized protein n=1 Tax=Lacipirellula parvula TaxID=2650471 RepID=A0A5K7XCL2_9BACT|nr:hypothetical protein [Lacipirellula parvula]BBO30829.1 hypothetical protein PLANPX_0441 [Lacipirellula parvula]
MAKKKPTKAAGTGVVLPKKLSGAKKPAKPKVKPPLFASMCPGTAPPGSNAHEYALPEEYSDACIRLEALLKMPVWLLVQSGMPRDSSFRGRDWNMLGDAVCTEFLAARHTGALPKQPIALVIDSNGGLARQTFVLASLLRHHCGGFVAVIPRRAKSAATLLSLGADRIILNTHAELGPLDVQLADPEREEYISGLDEVQSLERMHAFTMTAFDKMMLLLVDRSGKKTSTVMPIVSAFVSALARPMFENIDVVRYTQMSRLLKVAEEYAKRLLVRNYGDAEASRIATMLVENYPEHGFPIYREEAERTIGLKIADASSEIIETLEVMARYQSNLCAIGRVVKS